MMWYSHDPGTKSLILPAYGKLFRPSLSLIVELRVTLQCLHWLLYCSPSP